VHERLTLYKRLANCDDEGDLRAMQEELIDRYGEMPPQTQALLETHRIRLAARSLGIAKVDAGPGAIQLQFIANPPIDPANIIHLIQTERSIKLAGQDKLLWQKSSASLPERVAALRELFIKLSSTPNKKPTSK
jgi:transcription-repair coupling factor (superfamily II helicase)